MLLQSVPSPAGSTRRRPWAATLLVGSLFVTRGLSGASSDLAGPTHGQDLLREALDGVGVIRDPPLGTVGRRNTADQAVVELVARQIVSTSPAASPSSTSAPIASTSSTSLTSSIIPISTSTVPTSSATPTSSSSTSTSTSSSSSSISSSAAIPTSTAVPTGYELPQPFDSTLGTNFSGTACPSFFATFLADPDFVSCAPLSLLLGTSTGFFQAQRSPYSLLPYVLNATCAAPADACAAVMDKYARQIKLDNTCGEDLSQGNPLAEEALEGFRNYRLYREVGCQKDNSTMPQYCFVDASANPDPDSLYFYYLPEGSNLPSGTIASCDFCLEHLLGSYARYAVNSTLPISRTYASGRSVAALACGPNFAPIVSKTTSAAAWGHAIPFSFFLFAATSSILLFAY
ncbi:uncharacterized protein JCM15063_006486 [Sporobolomyces koalae]|uniref:uncharacterized protein n=1 Tax=Sporobolomyces koalae TaxID=500713 RepID=UPI00317C3E22